MGLDVIPILVGTIPVFLLIAPTVASGLFVYLGETEEWASTLSTVCLSVTGMAQSGSMLMAAFFLEKAVNEQKEALDAILIDKELKLADDLSAKKAKIFREAFSSMCFEVFEMTSKVADLPEGKAINLFKPGGFLAISLFALATIPSTSVQVMGQQMRR
ncbi:hypothetical protein TrRE_jg12299 [Triparma retinervis]|uniref:Uncharacterized protein n=1 Tax=Triparma retinervis TaxID=2557542 RepID=A0A9W7DRR0_9STRA|nr:hypothetical protein TrRE_jg12299 [Triparma retinervis]